MNYYIQGNKERAKEIKAAFEKLGIDVLDFGFADKTLVYCSIGGVCVQSLPYSINLMNILHSHPDYKELELPVEPKFKAGDWITNDTFTHCIVSIVDGFYYFYGGWYLDFGKIDGYYRLWSIQDAKDGDVLAADECYVIFKEIDGLNIKCYCTYYYMGFNPSFHIDTLQNKTAFHPATKEQRDLLFAKIKEAGYEWDEKEKELRKIKPHYDISNFHAGMPVLVRDDRQKEWCYALYSHYDSKESYQFVTAGDIPFIQCIPFNDETKPLLGTTDMCPKEYINW